MKKIQILGTGCPKCHELAENAEAAAKELDIAYELVKITDVGEITAFGVWMTPALAVDDAVKCAGEVPDVEKIKTMLEG